MTKIKALLLANSSVATKKNTDDEFLNAQAVVNEPMIIFCEPDFSTTIEVFEIVARDKDELNLMYKQKIFYTSSIPEGEVKHCYGSAFIGKKSNPIYQRKEEKESRIS